MQIQFQYSKTAVINALRIHFLNRRETKILRILLIVFFLLSLWGYFKGVIPYALVVIIFLLIILLTVVFWFVLPKSIYRKAKTFSEPTIELDCDEQGISIGTHSGARQLAWESFHGVLETPDFFYLYRNNNSFFLIPVNAFETQEEKQTFTQLLQRHFNDYQTRDM
jgi:hypothetical protein